VTFNDASPLVSQKEENLLLFLLIVTYCYETATSRQGLYASLLNALLNAYS
jgi:hypothetical protein